MKKWGGGKKAGGEVKKRGVKRRGIKSLQLLTTNGNLISM